MSRLHHSLGTKITLANWLILLLITFVLSTNAVYSDPSRGYAWEIPAQTKIPIIFQSKLDSDSVYSGEEFSAKTSEDVVIDGKVALPANSVLRESVQPSKRQSALGGS